MTADASLSLLSPSLSSCSSSCSSSSSPPPHQTAKLAAGNEIENANENEAIVPPVARRRSPRKRKSSLRVVENVQRSWKTKPNKTAMKSASLESPEKKNDRFDPAATKSDGTGDSEFREKENEIEIEAEIETENATLDASFSSPLSSSLPVSSSTESRVDAEKDREQETATEKASGTMGTSNNDDDDDDDDDDNDNDNEAGNPQTEPIDTSSSPSYLSPPVATETESRKRLSLLLSLRPPPLSTSSGTATKSDGTKANVNYTGSSNLNGQNPSSILRRRCIPAKEGDVYDGTTREVSAVDPTSDRHFDALVAFAASSQSPMNENAHTNSNGALREASQSSFAGASVFQETNSNSDSNSNRSSSLDYVGDPLIIDMETLGERLKDLFPKQFARNVGRGGRRPRRQRNAAASSPPCILPRLIACYTILRDHQRKQGDLGVELFANEYECKPSLSDRPAKRRRTTACGNVETAKSKSKADSMAKTGKSNSAAMQSIAPIRTLLQKLVELEWTVLEGHEHRSEEEGKSIPLPTAAIRSANSALATSKSKQIDDDDDYHLRRRRVQFAAFDDTAVVRAPSDVLEGSYKPQQDCVQALLAVLNVAEELFPKAVPVSALSSTAETSATRIVRDFVCYLENEFIPQCHDTVCVESLMAIENQSIPIGRIEKAAIAYSRDLNSLLNPEGKTIQTTIAMASASATPRETKNDNNDRDDDNGDNDDSLVVPLVIRTVQESVRTRPLSWECRLANTSAQLVRYWLRTLMNPVPDRSDLETKTDQWNSRLYDFVHITDPSESEEFSTVVIRSYNDNDDDENDYENEYEEGNDDDDDENCSSSVATFEDDKLSSLLSNALAHLYAYLDLGSIESLETNRSWKENVRNKIPSQYCCDTSVCEEGLGSGRHPIHIDEEDWQELEEHLREASDFCAFYRRALFVERLLTIVTRKNWTDHWNHTVQATAQKLLRLRGITGANTIIQPEDVHLAVLGIPLTDLLDRLRRDVLRPSRNRYELVRANLRRTEKNFRLGCKDTKRKKSCQPRIGTIEEHWKEWLHPDTIFPSVWYRDNTTSTNDSDNEDD